MAHAFHPSTGEAGDSSSRPVSSRPVWLIKLVPGHQGYTEKLYLEKQEERKKKPGQVGLNIKFKR